MVENSILDTLGRKVRSERTKCAKLDTILCDATVSLAGIIEES